MMRNAAVVTVLIGLAACAGLQPAGRNATRAEAPAASAPPVAPPPSETLPPPQPMQSQSPPPQMSQATPPPTVVAPSVVAPPPPPQQTADNADVTVTAPTERQVPAPRDPRSVAERREDIQNWDHCVMQVQASYDSDPMRPELDTPEDVCSRQLGMANRLAIPASRLAPHR